MFLKKKNNFCRSLGMCTKCGDVKNVACGRCKGTGTIKSGGIFGFGEPEPSSNARSATCDNCKGRGCFPCPECSKSWHLFWLFNRLPQDFKKKKLLVSFSWPCDIYVISPLVMLMLKHVFSLNSFEKYVIPVSLLDWQFDQLNRMLVYYWFCYS